MDANTAVTGQQLLMYGVIFGAVTGLIFGLVPLILGLKRDKRRLGILGFLICFLGGAVAGMIVSIPALIIFTWLIVRRAPTTDEKES